MSDVSHTREQAGLEGEWVCVGALGAPHGVKGALRLNSFTDVAADVFRFKELRKGPDGPLLHLKKQSASKGGFVVAVDGVNTPEAAAMLNGQKLYVPRSAFSDAEDDEYYLADLIGLTATDTEGAKLGVVHSVENFGAEDLIELLLDTPIKGLGGYAFIPFREMFIPHIDITAGTIVVDMQAWVDTQVSSAPEMSDLDENAS